MSTAGATTATDSVRVTVIIRVTEYQRSSSHATGLRIQLSERTKPPKAVPTEELVAKRAEEKSVHIIARSA
jgi:hypothetical protein